MNAFASRTDGQNLITAESVWRIDDDDYDDVNEWNS